MVKQWSFQTISFFQKDSLSLCVTSQIQTSWRARYWGTSVWPEKANDFSCYFLGRNKTKTACQDWNSFRGHLHIAKKNKTKRISTRRRDQDSSSFIWKSLYTGLPQNRFNSCFMPHLQLPLKPPKKTSHTQQHIFNHAETSVDGQPFSGRQGIKINIKLIKAREEEYCLNDVG